MKKLGEGDVQGDVIRYPLEALLRDLIPFTPPGVGPLGHVRILCPARPQQLQGILGCFKFNF